MKTTYKITRILGIIGGSWIFYVALYAQVQFQKQISDWEPVTTSASSLALNHLFTATIPFCLLAILLWLPYSRISHVLRKVSAGLIGILGIYLLIFLFRPYFFSDRFVPHVIPAFIWINVGIIAVFLIVQVTVISIYNEKY